MPDAVVLLSGGLDSYTAAAMIATEGFALNALTIRYGQVHAREVAAARAAPRALRVRRHTELDLDLRGVAVGADRASAVPRIGRSCVDSVDLRPGPQYDLPSLAWAETLARTTSSSA
jgi:7-cyano-7-deazaguanine synthase